MVRGVLVLSEVIVVVNLTALVDVATVGIDLGPEAVMHFETSVLVNGGTAGAFFAEATATRQEIMSGVKSILKDGLQYYYYYY